MYINLYEITNCCQTCAWSAVPEDKSEKVVFFHHQDNSDLKENNRCYIAWASPNPQEIIDTFKANDLTVEWNGKEGSRILVKE